MLNIKTFLLGLLFIPLQTVQAQGCANNPCQNGKSCYDIGEDDYECICEEFAGKHCQIQPPGVSCEASRIQVEIDRSWLIEKVQSDNHNYIYMGNGQSQNEACRATLSEDDPGKIHVTLDKNFRQCGTTVSRGGNGDYVYTNKVFFNVQNAGVQMAVAALVQWTCEYEDEYTVSSAPIDGFYKRDDKVKAKGIVGDFNLSTQAYLKPSFKAKDLINSYVTKGSTEVFHVLSHNKKWISFQTQLTGEAQARDTQISLKTCYFSSSRSPRNQNPDRMEEVITDHCPENEGITKMYQNGQGNNAQFATNILALRRNWMLEKPFYFHCEVQICPTGEYCPTGCSTSDSQDDDQNEPLIVYSTTGPYFWEASNALQQATLIEEDAEHSVGDWDSLMASSDTLTPEILNESEPTKTEDDFPLMAALACVSLLAVLVLSALITLWQRRGNGGKSERKIHRNATPINMNFAHEGSLRKHQRPSGYETVTTLSGRIQELPGPRPAAARFNYV
jgi:hypothetical protein